MERKISKGYEKDYTDPKLRAELKEKIKSEDKGGKKGQWSARKSQLLKKEYEAQGGGYKHKSQLTNSQKSLKKWTKQEWQTEDGTKAQKGNTTSRYLPKEVWNKMSEEEKKITKQSKEKESKKDKQYVKNPSSVTDKVRSS